MFDFNFVFVFCYSSDDLAGLENGHFSEHFSGESSSADLRDQSRSTFIYITIPFTLNTRF